MSHDLGADLDQLLAQGGQRPMLHRLRRCQSPLMAEGVEEVGANGFCATIVPVG